MPSVPFPIYVGGESKAALERAARLGDGYISIPHTLDDLESLMNELRRLRVSLAADKPPLRLHVHGSDLSTLGDYRRLADSGADSVNVAFWRRGREPMPWDERLEAMHNFADTVIAKL